MILKIKNLRLQTVIGIHEWENSVARQIIINAVIETDSDKAFKSDDIKDAIDYDELVLKIKKTVLETRFYLVEKMVGDLLDVIMEDKRIKKCQLEIDKIGAIADLESFSVTQIRERN